MLLLDERNPARSMPPSMRSCIAATWADRRDQAHGWDCAVARYKLVSPLPAETLQVAIAAVEQSLLPGDEQFVAAELGRLRLTTKSRDPGQVDLNLLFAVYTDELLRYPADLVSNLLRDWPRAPGNRFWPSISELTERLDEMLRPRLALFDALRRGYTPPPEQDAELKRPTAEDHVYVEALLRQSGITGRTRPGGRQLEREPPRRAVMAQVAEELRSFRLPDVDSPGVRARLQEMGEAIEEHFP
jgi:hypothetical protein